MLFRGLAAGDFCSKWKTHIHPFLNEDGVFMPTEGKCSVQDSLNAKNEFRNCHNDLVTARTM